MKIRLLFLLVLILAIADISPILARPIEDSKPSESKEKKFQFGMGYSGGNASRFFDNNSNALSKLPDSTVLVYKKIYVNADSSYYDVNAANYTFDYTKTTLSLFGKYFPTEMSEIRVELPISNYTLNERYTYYMDSIRTIPDRELFYDQGGRLKKDNFSLFRIDQLMLGGSYDLYKSKAILGFDADIRIPLGIGKAKTDSASQFLDDPAFEFLAGTHFGVDFQTLEINGFFKYHARAKNYSDMLLLGSVLSLKTVENTKLSFSTEFGQMVGSFDPKLAFKTRNAVYQENFIDVGVGFWIIIGDSFYTDFTYKLRLSGKNTWGIGTVSVSAGYRL